eukprot:2521660-Lingulodinium_polyedra.AAC.1
MLMHSVAGVPADLNSTWPTSYATHGMSPRRMMTCSSASLASGAWRSMNQAGDEGWPNSRPGSIAPQMP